MTNGTHFRHLIRESVTGLYHRKVSGSVAVVIMGSSLLMLALFTLVTLNLDRMLQTVRADIDLTVFLQDDIHPEDLGRLRGDLLATEGVQALQYIDREQALQRFRLELGDDAVLLDALEANPLPASFEVRIDPAAHDAVRIDDIARGFETYPGVEEVVAQGEWVQRLDQMTRIFLAVDLVIGLLVFISALFVISNTVRLTIEESAGAVEIMKLVGATNWFIQGPYVLSGAIQGAAAGGFAMGILMVAYHFLALGIDGILFFDPGQMLGFVVLSTLLGAGGSLLALRRHLRI